MKLHSIGHAKALKESIVGRVTRFEVPNPDQRSDSVLVWDSVAPPQDSHGYLAVLTPQKTPAWNVLPLIDSVAQLDYLADGDVVAISPSGFVRTLYRRNSQHNFILMTDQCNSYCLMCSQPPKTINDFGRINEHLRLIDLIDPATREIGITGGEPTLFKDDFIRLLEHCKARLPDTAVHVLSNGRLFFYETFAEKVGAVSHSNLMLGIPLYSDVDSEHDYVVQAKGAFEETVLGFYNLDRCRVPIEIRVVIHRQTYRRLPQLAEYIARNFPFVSHVVLMGLETFGFANKNHELLWIDPADYQRELSRATEILSFSGLNTSIYNHQLCILDPRLWPYARKSISDWKNIYLKECESCAAREKCGGLFQSAAKKHSAHIKALATVT